MPYSSADQRRVFLAYRAIFAGGNAHIRRQKKVLELVNKHNSSFKPLVQDFGVNKIVDILKSLLETRIFESELQAKVVFPDLFRSSPIREVQRTASENDAARSESQALEELESLEGNGNATDEETDGQPPPEVLEAAEVGLASLAPTSDNVPSLYPSYLPYNVQHVVLTITQRVLEECCFDFAGLWAPSILREHGWDCAEAVELTKWTRTLAKRSAKLPLQTLDLKRSSFKEVLLSVNRLRHTAVHRLPTTARGIDQLVQSALRLTETLNDLIRAAQLEELHYEIDSKIKAMELNKNILEDELNTQLRDIQEQRQELDKREKEVIATMLGEDKANKILVGLLLEEAVQKIFSEKLVSRAGLEEDHDTFETKNDEEEVNGFEETVDAKDRVAAQLRLL